MSIKWSLAIQNDRSLWLGLGDHLSTILLQIWFMLSQVPESDSLQIVEELILWQLLFAIVLEHL